MDANGVCAGVTEAAPVIPVGPILLLAKTRPSVVYARLGFSKILRENVKSVLRAVRPAPRPPASAQLANPAFRPTQTTVRAAFLLLPIPPPLAPKANSSILQVKHAPRVLRFVKPAPDPSRLNVLCAVPGSLWVPLDVV